MFVKGKVAGSEELCSMRPVDELTFRLDKNLSISVDNFTFISYRQTSRLDKNSNIPADN